MRLSGRVSPARDANSKELEFNVKDISQLSSVSVKQRPPLAVVDGC